MKESFLLYKGFYAPIKDFSDEELGQLLRLIFEYQINPENPVGFSVSQNVKTAFEFFKNQFRLDENKYQKIVERNQSNGRRGGRPRKSEVTQQNPENPVGNLEPKKADNDNEKENEKDLTTNIINISSRKFAKPSIDDIQNYCLERKNNVDAEKFYNYYESNGWKVGKNAMKDWKAAVRTWETNGYSSKRGKGKMSVDII